VKEYIVSPQTTAIGSTEKQGFLQSQNLSVITNSFTDALFSIIITSQSQKYGHFSNYFFGREKKLNKFKDWVAF
jgi:hypothetical protein